jgi:hypothetical protein
LRGGSYQGDPFEINAYELEAGCENDPGSKFSGDGSRVTGKTEN